ncbi:hypothetical protein BC940DRAFT_72757 [Gongronella butleri]|nr:hypothetical protein BC940DRAFT_72757 [Gongronella butleri]
MIAVLPPDHWQPIAQKKKSFQINNEHTRTHTHKSMHWKPRKEPTFFFFFFCRLPFVDTLHVVLLSFLNKILFVPACTLFVARLPHFRNSIPTLEKGPCRQIVTRPRLAAVRPMLIAAQRPLVTGSKQQQQSSGSVGASAQDPDYTNSVHAMYNTENQSAMEHHYNPNLQSVHYGDLHKEGHHDTFGPRFNTVFDE